MRNWFLKQSLRFFAPLLCILIMFALPLPVLAGDDECQDANGGPSNEGGVCTVLVDNSLGTCRGGVCVANAPVPEMSDYLAASFMIIAGAMVVYLRKRKSPQS